MELQQHYQDISATAWNQGQTWPVFDASLTGERIRFALASEAGGRIIRQDYAGRVSGDAIAGTVRISGAAEEKQMQWQAVRKDAPAR